MTWEAVADVDQLEEGEPLRVELGGVGVCVVLLGDDEAVAVHDTCSHQQQSLAEGMVTEDDTIICPAHSSTFDLRTGASVGVPEVPTIPVFACRISDGAVHVDVADQRNDAADPAR